MYSHHLWLSLHKSKRENSEEENGEKSSAVAKNNSIQVILDKLQKMKYITSEEYFGLRNNMEVFQLEKSDDIYEFMLDNIRKIMMPEEIISIDMTVSRLELLALLFIQRRPNITMGELAQSMVVPMSTATGVTDRLVKKKLLSRGRDATDRRIVTIALAIDGDALVGKFQNHFYHLFERVRKTVTEEEFELMLNLTRKVINGLQQQQAPSKEEQPATPVRINITIK